MRIISDFRDYYDSVQGIGFDDHVIYERKTQQIDIRVGNVENAEGKRTIRLSTPDMLMLPEIHRYRPKLRHLNGRRGDRTSPWINLGYNPSPVRANLYLCGKLYPFWIAYHPADQELPEVYSFEDGFDNLVEQDKSSYKWESVQADPTPYTKWLEENWGKEIDPKIHFYHKSPIVLYIGDWCIVDPCLKDFHLQKKFEPYTVFQEIEMFLGGVMGDLKEQPAPMTDKEKVTSHGFDPKYGFRKIPEAKD